MNEVDEGARASGVPRRWLGHTPLLVVLVAVAVAAAVLATACGDDSGGAGASSSEVNSPEAKEFRKLLGFSDADLKNLQGKEFKVGAILPLSGTGAAMGEDEHNGAKLAVDNMKRYMGVDVELKVLDHKSGDPQAAAAAARQLGIDGFGTAINSYYGVFGSTLKPLQQYKILSFDPGGGTGNGLKGKDFFYGFRANTPDDGFYSLRYFKQTKPDAKRVALVIWDAGAAYTDPIERSLKERIAADGMTYAGKLLSKIGATDYSSTISKLKALDPDIVALVAYTDDPGYFMKQYAGSGLKAEVVGSEYIPNQLKIAGAAHDGYMWASDYFPVDEPPNPLSVFFVDEYKQLFGEAPGTFFAANYYEATLGYLQLASRVAASGGDINSGEELNKEMVADPTFKSVYGGDDSTVGEIRIDPKTHDPVVRPVGLFQVAGTDIKQRAAWNIGGGEFEILGGS